MLSYRQLLKDGLFSLALTIHGTVRVLQVGELDQVDGENAHGRCSSSCSSVGVGAMGFYETACRECWLLDLLSRWAKLVGVTSNASRDWTQGLSVCRP